MRNTDSAKEPSSTWPEDYRCAVVLSFDFDAESDEMRTAPEKIVPFSKGRYGAAIGLDRIFSLHESFSLPATFFVPGWVAENYEDALAKISGGGFEVSGHGYLHEKVSELGSQEENAVYQKCMKAIRKWTKGKEVGYRAPWFDLSPRSLRMLSETGFVYDSSLMEQDLPYFVNPQGRKAVKGDSKGGLVELPVEWSLDDYPAFEVSRKSPREVREIWQAEFEALYAEGSFFNLTMHPECIGRPGRIEMLREFVRHMKTKRKVWFATALEVSTWWRKSH